MDSYCVTKTLEQRIGNGPRYFIYGLFDPKFYEIRYVGQTRQGQYRPWQHCYSRSLKKNLPVHSWIKSVIRQRRKIKWKILEVCSPDDLDEAEINWIKRLREDGCRLTNLALGGRTNHGCIPWNKGKKNCYSLETRLAMRKKKIGRKWSAEQKKRFKASVRTGKQQGLNRMGECFSRPVICTTDGKRFPSMSDAAKHYGYQVHLIRRLIKNRLGSRGLAKMTHRFILANPNHIPPGSGFYLGKTKVGRKGYPATKTKVCLARVKAT